MGLFDSVKNVLGVNEERLGPGDQFPDYVKDYRKGYFNDSIANLQTPQYWGGQPVAAIDPKWGNNVAWGSQWGVPGQGLGHDFTMRMQGASQPALGAVQGGMNFMNNMQQQGPNQFGLDLGTGAQIAQFLSPGVQQMFDVNADDIQRGYNFNQLPGLKMGDALSGGGAGWGQSKTGQQSALGDAMTMANIRNMGTNLWQNAANQAVQGAQQGGMANLNSANQFNQNMMSNYGRMGSLGSQMLGQANQMGLQNIGMGLNAGGQYQDYLQSRTDAEKNRWDFNQAAPWTAAGNMADLFNSYRMTGNPQNIGQGWLEAGANAVDLFTGGLGAYRDATK